MAKLLAALLGAGALVSLSGCGDSCESVQAEMKKIGGEIAKDPSTAPKRAGELEELAKKMRDLNCFG